MRRDTIDAMARGVRSRNESVDRPRVAAALRVERAGLVRRVHETLDGFMALLSALWIVLVVVELVGGGLPASLDTVVWAIWLLFLADFVLEFSIAPDKLRYVRGHWLTLVSLALPAVRVLRLFRGLGLLRHARVVRSASLLRVVTSINRGLASLGALAARRGLGYVVAATVLVIVVGSAGMAHFETSSIPTPSPDAAIRDFGDAVWWTVYAMTTGAPRQPTTGEGRLLGWLLSLYGLGVFGYLTATLASHFVGQEHREPRPVQQAARVRVRPR